MACAAPSPTTGPESLSSSQLSINNGTSVAITVTVNGAEVVKVPPNTTNSPISASLPARPWTVKALSPTGNVLASFTAGPEAATSDQASLGDVEFLTCGDLFVWVGGPMPDAPRLTAASLKPCD
ncbi:MAG TPA: hypothetical protein VIK08_02230 [Candidatus Limnocylindrales bacterium]